MKKLLDGTEIPDIIRYMTLEYRDRHLKEWYSEFGNNAKMDILSKEEFIKYAKKSFDFFISEINQTTDKE